MLWIVAVLVTLVAGCATYPRRMTEADCIHHVAGQMGYDVTPNGAWSPRAGTVSNPGTKVEGAGARINACLRSGAYIDAQGNVVGIK